MKRFPILILIILTVISCKRNKPINKNLKKESKLNYNNQQKQKVKEADMKIFYTPIRTDTSRYTQDIKIGNIEHKLELKLFSLNDSSVISVFENEKEVNHNYSSEIVLTKNNDTILYKKLTKEIFKDSIDFNDYNTLVLSQIGYENVRSNKLYFRIGFSNPSTPWSHEYKRCDIGIFYRTEKKGNVSYSKLKITTE